jgi:hypothetical protein
MAIFVPVGPFRNMAEAARRAICSSFAIELTEEKQTLDAPTPPR